MNRRRLVALLAGVTLAMSAAACGGSNEPAAPSTPGVPDDVTVGVIPIVDVAPIYLGKELGFFEEENINLTLDSAAGGAAIIPGVASGQFQFGFSNAPSILIAQTNNVPIKAIAPGNATAGDPDADFSGLVVKDPAITRPRDLEGKKVAANTLLGIVELSIRELVSMDGGDPSKVEVVAIPFPEMVAALDGDQVDAIFAVEPTLSGAKAKGWSVIGSFAAIDPEMTVALYFTSTTLAESNPDLVERFTRAIVKSLEYAQSHEDEVRDIVGTYTQFPEEVRAAMTLPSWPTEINSSSLDTLADLIVKYGAAPTRPDVSAVLS
jgi:NitT/TauT family transport system substrate-binding protein